MEGLLSTGPTPSSFMTAIPNNYSKITPIEGLHTLKISEAVMHYASTIAFPEIILEKLVCRGYSFQITAYFHNNC